MCTVCLTICKRVLLFGSPAMAVLAARLSSAAAALSFAMDEPFFARSTSAARPPQSAMRSWMAGPLHASACSKLAAFSFAAGEPSLARATKTMAPARDLKSANE